MLNISLGRNSDCMAILKTPKPRKESMHSPKPKSLKRVSTLSLTSSNGRSAASMPYFSIITRISFAWRAFSGTRLHTPSLLHRAFYGLDEFPNDGAGAALGIKSLFPEGHGFEARQRRLVQIRPGQGVRV